MRIQFLWSNLDQLLSILCSIPCFEIPEITIYLGSVIANESNGKSDKGNQTPEVGICKLCRLRYITVLWLADYLFSMLSTGQNKRGREKESSICEGMSECRSRGMQGSGNRL